MCKQWCQYFYRACGSVVMNWQNTASKQNLFGGNLFDKKGEKEYIFIKYYLGTTNVLADTWPTVDAFCQVFGSTSNSTDCFLGAPYSPGQGKQTQAETIPMCIEYFHNGQ